MVLDFVGVAGGGEPALARRYLFGPAVDQVLAQENVAAEPASAGRVLWQLVDHLGTTRDVVDSQGFFVVHFTYDSFGRLTSGAENVVTRYLYTGREWDAAAELQYSRARWYDPAAQRWISVDPLGFRAGDAELVPGLVEKLAVASNPQRGSLLLEPINTLIVCPTTNCKGC